MRFTCKRCLANSESNSLQLVKQHDIPCDYDPKHSITSYEPSEGHMHC